MLAIEQSVYLSSATLLIHEKSKNAILTGSEKQWVYEKLIGLGVFLLFDMEALGRSAKRIA